jgi:aminoglycoside phosphotransferase (APT) family kinase protein
LPPGRHHPPEDPPLPALLAEIDTALSDLPRPTGTPSHWRPMHGDFAPWNLRRLRDRSLTLIDWEDAGWGPPGADEVFYRATAAALWGTHPGPSNAPEAVAYWKRRVQSQAATARERRLANALDHALRRMTEHADRPSA